MRKPAKGNVDARSQSQMTKIAVGFPKELFDQISSLAQAKDRSFSAQVRALCRKAMGKNDE